MNSFYERTTCSSFGLGQRLGASVTLFAFIAGIASPSGLYAKTKNFDVEAAKLSVKNAEIKTHVEDKHYSIKYEGHFFALELIEGDHSTISLDGSLYSFDFAMTDNENIENLAKFISKKMKLSALESKNSGFFTKLLNDIDQSLFPRAHASIGTILIVALVIAAAAFFIVKASKKDKEKKKVTKKEKNYEAMIAEQFEKGDRFRAANADVLATNTKVYKKTREETPHNCWIFARAYHDNAKHTYKGYRAYPEDYSCSAI